MNRMLLIAAVLAFFLSGCGKDEEPQMGQAEKGAVQESAEEATSAADEAVDAAGDMADAVDEAATAAGEAVLEAENMVAAAVPAEGGRGKQVYDATCFACHAQGIAGAPMLGDKAAWESRISKEMDTLVNNAINGFQGNTGVMPPKGGNLGLSDEDVKAAVSYMVDQVK